MSLTAPAEKSCAAVYACGPVQLLLRYGDASLQEALHGLLSQYDAPWTGVPEIFSVAIETGFPPIDVAEPSGRYLRSYRLRVDRRGSRLVSLSEVGVWMDFDESSRGARIVVPPHPDRETVIEEVEQQLVLLLARGWVLSGWTPLHAGSLIPPGADRCVLVCAPSGVGKTTFTSAMLRRGWRALGDDKTLLRREGDRVIGRALSRRVHLHPSLEQWFPELAPIDRWPRYSRWTEKRMVKIEALWPGQLIDAAIPGAIVQLERAESGPAVTVEPLDAAGVFQTLLFQIAVPRDAKDARFLLSCAAAIAPQLRGARIRIGPNAFADHSTAPRLEAALHELLS